MIKVKIGIILREIKGSDKEVTKKWQGRQKLLSRVFSDYSDYSEYSNYSEYSDNSDYSVYSDYFDYFDTQSTSTL